MIGTVAGLIKASAKQNEIAEEVPPIILQKEDALYGEIGRLRISSADSPPISVIVTPFLQYAKADIALQEELIRKKEILKKVIISWFEKKNAVQLSTFPPDKIKKLLLEELNKQLVLGKIKGIYFEELTLLN
ncbi:flagellar basal body-associated protein FliL [Treponema phagedenis]|nr:flagellar basal body-associated protein FliL [Treponema phagedenis]